MGTNVSYYYVYKDYLGSILTVTNAAGSIVEEKNFDAWGKNRNTTDWTYNNIATSNLSWLTRGYTGHEHLQQFGLINMNGRLYDPILGRMLSPDNYTHEGSQGYNRYSYAMNNPLKYTDPSGQVAVVIAPIVYAGAALIGGVGNLWSNWDKVRGWKTGLAYFGSGAIGGAVSLHNPAAGGNITAFGNIAIDVLSGNFPKFNNFWDVAKYGAGKVLDGLGAAGSGGLAQAGYALAFNQLQKWGWLASYRVINGEFTTIASRSLERLAGYEISAKAANLARGAAAETETFYRAMSNAEYAALMENGGLSAKKGSELCVSKVEEYSRAYLASQPDKYHVLVQFETLPGTLDNLAENAFAHRPEVLLQRYKFDLPKLNSGWLERGETMFKAETLKMFPNTQALNVGLGYNPSIFNQNIINFFKIP